MIGSRNLKFLGYMNGIWKKNYLISKFTLLQVHCKFIFHCKSSNINCTFILSSSILFIQSRWIQIEKKFFRDEFAELAGTLGVRVLTWRELPRSNACLGAMAKKTEPLITQVFLVPSTSDMDKEEFAKKIFVLRKKATHRLVFNS